MSELRLGLIPQLEQAQEIRLALEQRLKFGPLEEQLFELARFERINLKDPRNTYHTNLLYSLLMINDETNTSLVGQILIEREELTEEDIEAIVVESFGFSDIDLDLGTKRNVDKVILKCRGEKELVMTVSIDKRTYKRQDHSPSVHETDVLSKVRNSTLVWSVQKWFGTTIVKNSRGIRGIICKEFLPGVVLANFTNSVEATLVDHDEHVVEEIAFQTGRMAQNAIIGLGGFPVDSNSLNIIINQDDEGNVSARYCDVEGLITDPVAIKHQIQL